MPRDKACGPSGLGPTHLKYFTRLHPGFIYEITNVLNNLIEEPANVMLVKQLYKFRAIFIPKHGKDWRPICIGEPILIIFHKLLTRRLRE